MFASQISYDVDGYLTGKFSFSLFVLCSQGIWSERIPSIIGIVKIKGKYIRYMMFSQMNSGSEF